MTLYDAAPKLGRGMFLPLPGRTNQKALEKANELLKGDCKVNPLLFLNKACIWWNMQGAFRLDSPKKYEVKALIKKLGEDEEESYDNIEKQTAKKIHLEHLKASMAKWMPAETDYQDLLACHLSLPLTSRLSRSWRAETTDRLFVCHTANTHLETGLALHPLYGFPIIPGSSLKGIALAGLFEKQGILNKIPLTEQKISTTLLNKLVMLYPEVFTRKIINEISLIFGIPPVARYEFPGNEGNIVFADAWPASLKQGKLIDLDSWTSHYPDFRDNLAKYPGDDQHPRPLLQICVGKGTGFLISVSVRKNSKLAKKAAQKTLDRAAEYLGYALTEVGAGSKTSSGYGYFN